MYWHLFYSSFLGWIGKRKRQLAPLTNIKEIKMPKHVLTVPQFESMPFETSTEALGQILHFAQEEFDNPEDFIRSVCEQLSHNTGVNFCLHFFPTNPSAHGKTYDYKSSSPVRHGKTYQKQLLHTRISAIQSSELPIRAKNFLQSINVDYLYQLLIHSEQSLLREPHCGRRTLNLIKNYVESNGFTLARHE